MTLSNLIKEIGNTYFKEKKSGKFKGAPVGNLVKNKMVEELKKIEELNGFKIEGSIGNGQFASIPWLAIMNKEVTEQASQGFYIVFLFSADGERVYLTLNQAANYFKEKNYENKT